MDDLPDQLRAALGKNAALRRACTGHREAAVEAVDAESDRVRGRMDALRGRALTGSGAAYLARAEQLATLTSASRTLAARRS